MRCPLKAQSIKLGWKIISMFSFFLKIKLLDKDIRDACFSLIYTGFNTFVLVEKFRQDKV